MQISVQHVFAPATEQVVGAWDRFVARLEAFVDFLPILGVAVGILAASAIVASLVRKWDAPFRLLTKSSLLRSVLRNITSTFVFLIGAMIALEILDATKFVGAILGAAGVVGLALGFAFKDIVENYLASILLALRRPFASRDLVQIDDHLGKVMSLSTRATVLMTLDGNHVRLPNSMVFKAVITNFSRNPRRRFHFGLGAGVNEDLTAAQKLGAETLNAMDGVCEDPKPFSLIKDLGDSTVSIEFYGWVNQADHDFSRVRSEAIRRIKIAFDEADIEMPEPTYRVAMVEPGAAKAADAKQDAASAKRRTNDNDNIDIGVDNHIDRQIAAEASKHASDDELAENLL